MFYRSMQMNVTVISPSFRFQAHICLNSFDIFKFWTIEKVYLFFSSTSSFYLVSCMSWNTKKASKKRNK